MSAGTSQSVPSLRSLRRYVFGAVVSLAGCLFAAHPASSLGPATTFAGEVIAPLEPVSDHALYDVDADGALDLVGLLPRGFAVYYGNGNGTFAASPQEFNDGLPASFFPPTRFVVADLNDDSLPEICLGYADGILQIVENKRRTYSRPLAFQPFSTFQGNVEYILPRDCNNDGAIDLAVSTGNRLRTLQNAGGLNFVAMPEIQFDFGYLSREPVDFNGDGNWDLVLGDNHLSGTPGYFKFIYSDGQGGWALGPTLADTNSHDAHGYPADFNGDGYADFVVGVRANRARILFGDGAGGAIRREFNVGTWNVNDIYAADLNRDGLEDLILNGLTDNSVNPVFARFGFAENGSGLFTEVNLYQRRINEESTPSVIFGDLDGDRRIDLMHANGNSMVSERFSWRNTTPNPPTASPNPISAWTGDDTADALPGGLNGEVDGEVEYVEGVKAKAFGFGESGGIVRIPDDSRLALSESFTISAWIYPEEFPGDGSKPGVIFMRGDNRPYLDPYMLAVRSSGDLVFSLQSQTGRVSLATPIAKKRWSHVAATLDIKNHWMRLYVDGALAASRNTPVQPVRFLAATHRPSCSIGNHEAWQFGGPDWAFRGAIDDVRIYGVELSPATVEVISEEAGPKPPAAPAGLVSQTSSETELRLIWEDRSHNETEFELERLNASGQFQRLALIAPNTTTYLDRGLTPQTDYTYRLRAVNDEGPSAYAGPVTGRTGQATLNPPGELESSSFNQSDVGLFWTDTNDVEEGYRVERSVDGVSYKEVKVTRANATETHVTQLTANTKYWFRLRAFKGPARSTYSAVVTATTPPLPPLPPINLRAQAFSAVSVKLIWDDRSPDETNFYVEERLANETFTLVARLGPNVTTWTGNSHLSNRRYQFRIRARNNGGFSSYSAVAETLTFPAAPSNLAVSVPPIPDGRTKLDLGWTGNSNQPSAFILERALAKSGPWDVSVAIAAGAVKHRDSALKADTLYWYRIRATNTSGDSANTPPVSARTLPDPPPPLVAPDQLAATVESQTRVRLNWRDRSSDETGFKIERATGAGSFSQVTLRASNAVAWTDATVAADSTYRYRVRAVRGTDQSDYSNVAQATTPPFPPNSPANLKAQAAGIEKIALSWQDRSANEDQFVLSRAIGENGAWADLKTLPANTITYSDSDVQPATTYQYRLLARNSGGDSAYSNTARATLPRRVRGILNVARALDFGAVKLRKKKTLSLTILNDSAAEDLQITVGVLNLPFAIEDGGGKRLLAPKESFNVQVSFTPKKKKPKKSKGSLTISSSDPDNTAIAIAISGKLK